MLNLKNFFFQFISLHLNLNLIIINLLAIFLNFYYVLYLNLISFNIYFFIAFN